MGAAIRTEGLGKKYFQQGEVDAVVDFTIEVQEGEIYGFLGPNGAGKTTTIKMLLGLIFPTAGSAEVLGRPAGDLEMRRQVSYLPESPYFYDHLTGVELLDFYGRLFGIGKKERERRVHELMDQVGLKNDKAKHLKQYSKGMLQRIGIAQALVNDPKLLILDEPTSGLDPVAHIEIRHLIQSLKDRGKTIFLSSHQLADVERVCDRIAILNFGKLVRSGTVSQLTSGTRTEIVARMDGEAVTKLRERVPDLATQDGTVVINETDPAQVDSLIDFIRGSSGQIVSVIPQRQRLEDVFIESVGLTGGRQIGTMNQLTEDMTLMNAWVIARNTLGDALRKRVLLVFLLLAMVMLLLALMLQYFTAREQMVTFKSTELAIILIFGTLIAITTSIFLIPSEIEKRTIYSVLSKPVQRWEFFLGKFLGGVLTAAVTLGLMAIVLMIVVFILSARPAGGADLAGAAGQTTAVSPKEWLTTGFREISLVLQGCYVILFELVLITAIATTLSLWFSPTVNFSITAFIFVTGSLQDVMAAWTRRNDLPLTKMLANAFYYITPHFEDFNIVGHIVHPEVALKMSPIAYALEVSLYGVVYGLMILLIGALVFDKKEV